MSDEELTRFLRQMIVLALRRQTNQAGVSCGTAYAEKAYVCMHKVHSSFTLVVAAGIADETLRVFEQDMRLATLAVFGVPVLITFYRSYELPPISATEISSVSETPSKPLPWCGPKFVVPEYKIPVPTAQEPNGEPEAGQPVAGESEVKLTAESPGWKPAAEQLYMRIISPNGKLLGDTPISPEFMLQDVDKPEYELQDGAYGLHEYCKTAFGNRAGGDVAFRIGKLLLEQLSVSGDKLATCFGFTAQLLKTRPIPNCWPKDLLEAKQPVEPKLGYADLSRLTPAQILQGAEGMADEFYRLEGWKPPMESYRSTGNPRAVRIWGQVKIAYERLAATSLDDVVSELDEGEDPKL